MKNGYFWDSIKGGVAFALMIVIVIMGAYMFGRSLKPRIALKAKLDSLRIENLRLDNELKRHKLKSEK